MEDPLPKVGRLPKPALIAMTHGHTTMSIPVNPFCILSMGVRVCVQADHQLGSVAAASSPSSQLVVPVKG
eukprot:4404800-Amphidinium_carterae.1